MSFFHGITTSLIDTGPRTISLPSSSIIGLCDTFTPGVLGGGSAKAGELIEQTYKYALTYYKLTVDGEQILEIDLVNLVEIVHGEDRLSAVRAALGV